MLLKDFQSHNPGFPFTALYKKYADMLRKVGEAEGKSNLDEEIVSVEDDEDTQDGSILTNLAGIVVFKTKSVLNLYLCQF